MSDFIIEYEEYDKNLQDFTTIVVKTIIYYDMTISEAIERFKNSCYYINSLRTFQILTCIYEE